MAAGRTYLSVARSRQQAARPGTQRVSVVDTVCGLSTVDGDVQPCRTRADAALVLRDDDVRREGRQALRVDAVHGAALRRMLAHRRINGDAGQRRVDGGIRAARQLWHRRSRPSVSLSVMGGIGNSHRQRSSHSVNGCLACGHCVCSRTIPGILGEETRGDCCLQDTCSGAADHWTTQPGPGCEARQGAKPAVEHATSQKTRFCSTW